MNFSLEIIPFEERGQLLRPSAVATPTKLNRQGHQNIKSKIPKQKRPKVQAKEKISWNPTETKRYLKFIAQFKELLELQKKAKRVLKLNLKMSKAIKTREPSQCHSHHQKMIQKYGSIEEIIKNLQHLLQGTVLKEKSYQKIQKQQLAAAQTHLQNVALKLDYQYTPLLAMKKQEEAFELMQMESFQRNLEENYFDCFID